MIRKAHRSRAASRRKRAACSALSLAFAASTAIAESPEPGSSPAAAPSNNGSAPEAAGPTAVPSEAVGAPSASALLPATTASPPVSPEPSVPPRTAPLLEVPTGQSAPPPDDSTKSSRDRRTGKPRFHDSFYARFAAGPGLFHADASTSPANRTFSGGTAHVELSIGGTVAKGVIIGGTYLRSMIFGLSAKDENGPPPTLNDVTFTLSAGTVFADVYPNPARGLHFFGGLGYGTLLTGRDGGYDMPSGTVFTAGAGYEWFLADQWSVGVLARATYGSFSVRETLSGSTDVAVLIPTLLAGVTYN